MRFTRILLWLCAFSVCAEAAADQVESLQVLNRALEEAAVAAHPEAAVVTATIRQRAVRLVDLMRVDASAVRGALLSDATRAALKARYPDAASWLETEGVWEGVLECLIADDADFTHSTAINRLKGGDGPLEVFFAGQPPVSKSGARLAVEGIRILDVILVLSAQALEAPQETCSSLGEQKTAVLMVKFPSSSAQSITPADVQAKFFGRNGQSLDGYWREVSREKTWATGDVFGWYTLDRDYTCDQYDQILQAAIVQADSVTDLRKYNRLFVTFPRPPGCAWAGLTRGCSDLTSPRYGAFRASVVWLEVAAGWGLPAHEGGHALGILHANTRRFAGRPLGAVGEQGDIQYMGDAASVMGHAGYDGHYSARHKLILGWLSFGSDVLPVEGSGVFTVSPLAIGDAAPKALRIRRKPGIDAWIWVEYRQPGVGYDTYLPKALYEGALLHYEDSFNAGSGLVDTHLLDFTPNSVAPTTDHPRGDFEDATLVPGVIWSDPETDLTLEVLNKNASGLTIKVDRPKPDANSLCLLPSSARATGLGGAFYTTDLTVANTGSTPTTFVVKFLGNNADGRSGLEKSFPIGASASKTFADVLGSVFGLTADYGAIRITSPSDAVRAIAQTSTPGFGGTFGQSVPASRPADLITGGTPRSILAVREDDSFRTNLILANATEDPLDVDVTLVADSGIVLGTAPKRFTLPPLGMTQVTRVVRVLGVTADVSGARLVVSTPAIGKSFAAYASAIDNVTNDPRTLLPVGPIVGARPSPDYWILPSSARANGAGGAFYTTDVTVAYTNAVSARYTLKFLGNNADGRSGPETTFDLGPQKSVTYTDVLGSVFQRTSDYGAIRVGSQYPSSDSNFIGVLAQTSTPGFGGTFGQSVPATTAADLIRTGTARSILAVREDDSFRTNLILTNATEAALDVDVQLISAEGAALTTKRYFLAPLGMTQVTRVVRDMGIEANVNGARLVISTPTASGAFAAYASAIDNVTNDPRTLLPR